MAPHLVIARRITSSRCDSSAWRLPTSCRGRTSVLMAQTRRGRPGIDDFSFQCPSECDFDSPPWLRRHRLSSSRLRMPLQPQRLASAQPLAQSQHPLGHEFQLLRPISFHFISFPCQEASCCTSSELLRSALGHLENIWEALRSLEASKFPRSPRHLPKCRVSQSKTACLRLARSHASLRRAPAVGN